MVVDDQTPGRTSVLLLEQLDQMPTALQRWLLDALPAESLPFRLMATITGDDELTGDSPAATELLQLIGTIHIRLPALHSRHEDLPTLAQVLLEDCNRDAEKQIAGFTRESLDLLALYGWPGDVRELRTVIQEAYRNAAGPLIEVNNLPAVVHHAAHAVSLSDSTVETIVLDDYLAMIERELVERALAAADGNKAQAARLLGMTRPRLYRRLVQLGLATQSESPLFEPDEPSTEAGM